MAFAQLYRDFAVRTRDAKWILAENGERRIVALDTDPAEKAPRTPMAAELVQAEETLRTWYDAHVTDLYARDGGEILPDDLSPEAVSRLQSLGYLR